MADHLWFIPVSAGGSFGPVPSTWAPLVPPWEFNVQWNFQVYPGSEPDTSQSCISAHPSVIFSRSTALQVPNTLFNCAGEWTWRSCTNGERVTVGGQLGVGVVFSRLLNLYSNAAPPLLTGSASWNKVEAWVKFRVNTLGAFDAAYFSINDATTPVPLFAGLGVPAVQDWLPLMVPGAWFVAYAFKTGFWNGWTSENLRAVLTVLGTSIPANVGLSIVDVEWFAIRLSEGA